MNCSNCIAINEPVLYKCKKYKNLCDECKNDIKQKFKWSIVYPKMRYYKNENRNKSNKK